MATRDYRYTGFNDENSITEIMLYSLPVVVRARKDRKRYLENMAMASPALSGKERVQGGSDEGKEQRYVENVEHDKILGWLSLIETRVGDKVKHLSLAEKTFVKKYYFSGKIGSVAKVAMEMGCSASTANSMRIRTIGKLRRACTSVYHVFCLWREQDDRDMDERSRELSEIID